MNYKNFEELPIWKQAREIVNLIYKIIDGNESLKKIEINKSIERSRDINYE